MIHTIVILLQQYTTCINITRIYGYPKFFIKIWCQENLLTSQYDF